MLPDHRMRLRPFRPTDAAAVESLLPYLGAESATQWLATVIADEQLPVATRRIHRAVTIDDAAVGAVMLSIDSWPDRRAEVGFVVAPDHRRQGLAHRAVGAVISREATPLGLHRVWAVTTPDNEAARSVLVSNGFLQEGRLRDDRQLDNEWVDSLIFGRIL